MAGLVEQDPLKESGRYERLDTLGKGAFGFVLLGRNLRTNELAAIKFLKRGDVNKYVESEILNHSTLRHPHVIQFKEVFLTNEYICIAMEYATGGSLFHYVQKQTRLKEAVARWFFQQLVIGVDYCHKRGVANRDIKLENTLLQKVNGLPLPLLKICDFGYSKADFKSAAKSKVLVNRDGKYDGKVADIWSCGVMLYVMLYGRYPFETPAGVNVPKAAEILAMLDSMVRQRYDMPASVEISDLGKDLLTRMLLPEPRQRITLEQVMAHAWFTTNLPAEAAAMNDTYLSTPFPPGHQTPEDIRRILEEAKGRAHARMMAAGGGYRQPAGAAPGGPGGGVAAPGGALGGAPGGAAAAAGGAGMAPGGGGGDDSYDSLMDSAINEDLQAHSSAALQQFVHNYR